MTQMIIDQSSFAGYFRKIEKTHLPMYFEEFNEDVASLLVSIEKEFFVGDDGSGFQLWQPFGQVGWIKNSTAVSKIDGTRTAAAYVINRLAMSPQPVVAFIQAKDGLMDFLKKETESVEFPKAKDSPWHGFGSMI